MQETAAIADGVLYYSRAKALRPVPSANRILHNLDGLALTHTERCKIMSAALATGWNFTPFGRWKVMKKISPRIPAD
jgi:hypothetical protein